MWLEWLLDVTDGLGLNPGISISFFSFLGHKVLRKSEIGNLKLSDVSAFRCKFKINLIEFCKVTIGLTGAAWEKLITPANSGSHPSNIWQSSL